MKKFVIAFLVFISVVGILSSCSNGPTGHLNGTVIESTEVTISEITPRQLVPMDTLLIQKGKFAYSPKVDRPTFLLLEFDSGSRIPLLFTPGEKISLLINDTVPFGTFSSEGSIGTARMAKQRSILVATSRFLDSLDYVNELYADSTNYPLIRTKLNEAFEDRMEEHRQALHNLIDEDTTDLSNIMAFYQSLGSLEFMDIGRDYTYFRKVNNGLQANYPENEHAKYLNESLKKYYDVRLRSERIQEAATRITIGNSAPEISLPDLDGTVRNLTALRGNVVLIDFWASWCGPCRRANPDLVKLYDKYQNEGFEIFSVSLDGIPNQANAKNDWRFAIEKDQLRWPNHVSDLKGYQSAVVELYGFEGIPFSILIDREGKILAKNIQANQLEAEIKKAL